jgi:hypothetical protein
MYKSCFGCEKRIATSEHNCHSDCPDYKAFKEEQTKRAETIRKKKCEEGLITETLLRSIQKTTRGVRKQTAWKG